MAKETDFKSNITKFISKFATPFHPGQAIPSKNSSINISTSGSFIFVIVEYKVCLLFWNSWPIFPPPGTLYRRLFYLLPLRFAIFACLYPLEAGYLQILSKVTGQHIQSLWFSPTASTSYKLILFTEL